MEQKSLAAELEQALATIKALEMENAGLRSELQKANTDSVSGLRWGSKLHSDLFAASGEALRCATAEGLRRGVPVDRFDVDELAPLWIIATAIDVDYLTLWNNIRDRHSDGNLAMRGIGNGLKEASEQCAANGTFYRLTGGDELAGLMVCSQATAVSTLNLAQHLAGQTVVFEGQPLPVGFVYGCATLIEALVLYGSLDPKLRPEGGRDVTTVTFKLLMELGDARSNGTKRMRRWLLLTKLFLHRRDFFDQFLDDLTRAMQKPRREILAIVERLAKMNPEERMVYISMMTERRRSRLLTDAQTSGPRQITGEKDLPHQALLHVYRMARPRELEKVIKPLF